MRRSYTQRRGKGRKKDTMTHQIRRVGLDPDTLELLAEAWEDFGKIMAQLGVKAEPAAFIFSYQPDHSKPCNPDGITHLQPNVRPAGDRQPLHAGRHYSATELIGTGVDIRTIAGRLGHGGGGTTTLPVYAAWLAESDK